jgi:hypothetical protein
MLHALPQLTLGDAPGASPSLLIAFFNLGPLKNGYLKPDT